MGEEAKETPMATAKPPLLSYTNLRPRPWWLRQLLEPIGWPLCTAGVLGCLLILLGCSVPGWHFEEILVGSLCGVSVLVLYALRLIVRAILIHTFSDPPPRFWRQGWRWVVPPAAMLLTLFLCAKDAPLALRFHLGRFMMERAAREVMTTPPPYTNRWVGLFPAEDVEAIPDGMRFLIPDTVGGGMAGHGEGFAYCPHKPVTDDGFSYTPYYRNWYCTSGYHAGLRGR